MTLKKYTLYLDGLPSHESVIFKLICSVSERTKNRNNTYSLTTDITNADIHVNDIKKITNSEPGSSSLNIWVTDKSENTENVITRPLIATRVLHTLDKLIENIKPSTSKHQDTEDTTEDVNIKQDNFNITEEEASELAIVHDEVFENPANKEETENDKNVELTLIKNNKHPGATNTRTGTQYVLVVDDSPSVRKQLEIELDLFDANVDYADCANSAFELLAKNKYDIALLDVVLPDRDGFQICKKIKADSKETIAIMLTGKATQADKIKGSLAGCNDYLIKPVGRQTFQNAVKNYIPMKETKTAIEA